MYKGIEMTSIDNYIFDTLPYNEEINIDEIRNIENSLRNYMSGYQQNGISYDEAFKFMDWLTFNARSAATNGIPESAMSAPLTGACAPTQCLNTVICKKIGLDARPFNMGDCVGQTPMTEEDIQRINNGFFSTNVRHSVATVKLPIQHNGVTTMQTYLLDPTFRQFCLKENCSEEIYWDSLKNSKGQVAPHPAYFLTEEYLTKQGKSKHKIDQSNYIAQVLINRGYMELSEENAKIYGDAFAKAGIRYQFKDVKLQMSGQDYIEQFENNPMKILGLSDNYKNFNKTPLEIEDKVTFLDKLKNFFKGITQRNKQKCLPEPTNFTKNTAREEFMQRVEYADYKYPDLKGRNKEDLNKSLDREYVD